MYEGCCFTKQLIPPSLYEDLVADEKLKVTEELENSNEDVIKAKLHLMRTFSISESIAESLVEWWVDQDNYKDLNEIHVNNQKKVAMFFSTDDDQAQEARDIDLFGNIVMFDFGLGCDCSGCIAFYTEVPAPVKFKLAHNYVHFDVTEPLSDTNGPKKVEHQFTVLQSTGLLLDCYTTAFWENAYELLGDHGKFIMREFQSLKLTGFEKYFKIYSRRQIQVGLCIITLERI